MGIMNSKFMSYSFQKQNNLGIDKSRAREWTFEKAVLWVSSSSYKRRQFHLSSMVILLESVSLNARKFNLQLSERRLPENLVHDRVLFHEFPKERIFDLLESEADVFFRMENRTLLAARFPAYSRLIQLHCKNSQLFVIKDREMGVVELMHPSQSGIAIETPAALTLQIQRNKGLMDSQLKECAHEDKKENLITPAVTSRRKEKWNKVQLQECTTQGDRRGLLRIMWRCRMRLRITSLSFSKRNW